MANATLFVRRTHTSMVNVVRASQGAVVVYRGHVQVESAPVVLFDNPNDNETCMYHVRNLMLNALCGLSNGRGMCQWIAPN